MTRVFEPIGSVWFDTADEWLVKTFFLKFVLQSYRTPCSGWFTLEVTS